MKIYFRLNKVIIILLFLVSLSYSQHIKVENGAFKVINYTLPEYALTYCIYDYSEDCVLGGVMDAKDFYEWNYFTLKIGKYRIVIRKDSRIFINEIVEIK